MMHLYSARVTVSTVGVRHNLHYTIFAESPEQAEKKARDAAHEDAPKYVGTLYTIAPGDVYVFQIPDETIREAYACLPPT